MRSADSKEAMRWYFHYQISCNDKLLPVYTDFRRAIEQVTRIQDDQKSVEDADDVICCLLSPEERPKGFVDGPQSPREQPKRPWQDST
jgi:hypothetical protein